MLNCLTLLAGIVTGNVPAAKIPGNYQLLSASQKQKMIWREHIIPTAYQALPGYIQITPSQFIGTALALPDFRTTFTHESDFMPTARVRVIHALGSVAPIIFRGNPGSRLTGLLKEKEVPGLARISLAGPPQILGFTPGIALKLFVDHKPSVNVIAMNSVNGQGSNTNPFALPFSNIIPPPRGALLNLLGTRFRLTVSEPERLSLNELGKVNLNGNTVTSPLSPYQILLAPRANNGIHISENSNRDFREDLAEIPTGTVLYDVYAKDSPQGPYEQVGEIVTQDAFVASKFGDKSLFFQHKSDTLRTFGF